MRVARKHAVEKAAQHSHIAPEQSKVYASVAVECRNSGNKRIKYQSSKTFPLPRKTLDALLTLFKHLSIAEVFAEYADDCKRVVRFHIHGSKDELKEGFWFIVKRLKEKGIGVEVVERGVVS
jgi:hypothetical protein